MWLGETGGRSLTLVLFLVGSAGEGKLGTDEEVFNRILAHESFDQLRLIFEEYKNVSGRTIQQAIRDELSGELKEAIGTIGTSASPFSLNLVSPSLNYSDNYDAH